MNEKCDKHGHKMIDFCECRLTAMKKAFKKYGGHLMNSESAYSIKEGVCDCGFLNFLTNQQGRHSDAE